MAVLPFETSPVLRNRRYTHMAPLDVAVWERFLDRFGGSFVAVSYDVALGGVALPEAAGQEAQRLGWQYSTALKIDAVLWEAGQAHVVEVKPWAGPSAIGAAITYALVAQREQLTELPVRPAIVCEAIQPDCRWVAEQLAIRVWEV